MEIELWRIDDRWVTQHISDRIETRQRISISLVSFFNSANEIHAPRRRTIISYSPLTLIQLATLHYYTLLFRFIFFLLSSILLHFFATANLRLIRCTIIMCFEFGVAIKVRTRYRIDHIYCSHERKLIARICCARAFSSISHRFSS